MSKWPTCLRNTALILLTACSLAACDHCREMKIPPMSDEAKTELRTLLRPDGKRFKPEYENLEDYFGQIEKIKRTQ